MPRSAFYIKKNFGFSPEVADNNIAPVFYQPTPEGVKLLCAHYSAKYNIHLSSLDLRVNNASPYNMLKSFEYLVKIHCIGNLVDNTTVGIVLSHGQRHAIPVLIKKQAGKSEIVVFDSTSGPIVQGYFRIASLFSAATFYLNSGSRQADSISCITDAICILKEALQLDNLFDLLAQKRYDNHPSLLQKKSRFFSPIKPDNFIVFKMPEQLLLTAQRSRFVTESDANTSIQLRGGKTLGEYRRLFQMRVSVMQGDSVMVKGINSYLFVKARQHKALFDAHAKKTTLLQEMTKL